MTSAMPDPIPLSAQPIPFGELLESGKVPEEFLATEYITQQFVERLIHSYFKCSFEKRFYAQTFTNFGTNGSQASGSIF